MKRGRRRFLGIAAAALAMPAAARAQAIPVDLALVLAVDCSRSIDADEFALQIKGYAEAFRHPTILNAIVSGVYRAIAVTYVQWAGPFLQNQVIPWTMINDAESAEEFSDRMAGVPRVIFGGGTSLSGAIDYARTLFRNAGYEPQRRVIDVSGDGINNSGRLVQSARDDAVAAGITINGLAILTEIAGLDRYFNEFMVGGPGAFVIAVESFDDFAQAVLNKLIREIAGELPDGAAA